MKKLVLAVALSAALVTNGQAASAGPLRVNGAPVDASGSYVHQNTTYVPLRTITEALRPDAEVDWVKDRAVVRAEGLKLTARPGDAYIEANGRTLYAKDGVHLKAGRTLVPVRVLAEALGATVDWNPATGVVSVNDAARLQPGGQALLAVPHHLGGEPGRASGGTDRSGQRGT